MAERADREMVAHLLRRAIFGPTAEEVDAAERDGVEATIARVAGPSGPLVGPAVPEVGADPYYSLPKKASRQQREAARAARRAQVRLITEWWLDRMVANGGQLEEKMVFFWHGHWATSVEKVDAARLMMLQHNTFRRHGQGDFAELVKAMLRDPALILWLDGQRNTRKAPNENLARELMELFTLGIGNYSEEDVKAGAKALTGWTVDRAMGGVKFAKSRFDAGEKTILEQTGKFDADGFARILIQQPASARFVVSRLWFRFASGEPIAEDVLHRLVRVYSPGRGLTTLMMALLRDPAFAKTRGQLVKQPLEWAVGAMRQLRVRPSGLSEKDRKYLLYLLDGLDQVPFRPPSVGGWPSGVAWLTSHSAQVRLRLAELLAARAPGATVAKLSAAPTAGRVAALARLLVVDEWTPRTRAVLDDAAKDVRKLLALGLASPEYSIH